MSYPIALIFGLSPSIIWLLFFLRKDVHPESNKMVLKIFFLGALITLPAVLIELGIEKGLNKWASPLASAIYIFLGIAFVEEFLKYLVVREKVLSNPEFDEPVDVLLYMIIAALGFAALENILVLLPKEKPLFFYETAIISFLRFIGATFLHALCSGTMGYFLALSFFEIKKKLRLTILGLVIATVLHGLFNLFIMEIDKTLLVYNGEITIVNFPLFIFLLLSLIAILIGLAIFVLFSFKKVKKLTSTCKIK